MDTEKMPTDATNPPADPAAVAFNHLRREVAVLRVAVEHLVDAPAKIEIPDYTDSLAELRQGIVSLISHYRKLSERPALAMTPDQLAAQIIASGEKARAAERQSLQTAEATFLSLGRELASFVQSAQTADRQTKWLLAMLLLGIAIGAGAVILVT